MFLCSSIFPLLLLGGVLGRVDFDNTGIGRLYAETCGHAAKVHHERDSSDVRGASGRKAECGSGSVKSVFYI